MTTNAYGWLDDALAAVHRAGWYRSTQAITSTPGPVIQLGSQTLLNFGSNDYLGLAGDQRLIQAAIAATAEFGTGSTGSRLITGQRELHHQLEQQLARLKQTEAALVFSSGYLANLGTISALVGKRDLVLSDQYNHSSLKNGAILSSATVYDYAHISVQDLQAKLEQHRSQYRRCLILTDTVFSMDGDLCPLPAILDLANHFSCMVLVDEAHATGVMGATGAGCVEHLGCTGQPLIQMGTLSKALGSLGGYVAGSATLIDYLRNRCPTWIYTTGLSPADTAAALAAVTLVQEEPQRRDRLWQNVRLLQQLLAERLPGETRDPAFFKLLPTESPIFCLQLPTVQTALQTGQALRQAGFFVPAVRPPTVPTSRLRLTVMATHEPVHLEKLMDALMAL